MGGVRDHFIEQRYERLKHGPGVCIIVFFHALGIKAFHFFGEHWVQATDHILEFVVVTCIRHRDGVRVHHTSTDVIWGAVKDGLSCAEARFVSVTVLVVLQLLYEGGGQGLPCLGYIQSGEALCELFEFGLRDAFFELIIHSSFNGCLHGERGFLDLLDERLVRCVAAGVLDHFATRRAMDVVFRFSAFTFGARLFITRLFLGELGDQFIYLGSMGGNFHPERLDFSSLSQQRLLHCFELLRICVVIFDLWA